MNQLQNQNANLIAGKWDKESAEYKSAKENMPKIAEESIDIIKKMPVKTAEGKELKDAYLDYFELQLDLLNKNIAAVKSGKDSDLKKVVEANSELLSVQKRHSDALKALNTAIKNAKP